MKTDTFVLPSNGFSVDTVKLGSVTVTVASLLLILPFSMQYIVALPGFNPVSRLPDMLTMSDPDFIYHWVDFTVAFDGETFTLRSVD